MKKSFKKRLTVLAAGCMVAALSMAVGCKGSLEMSDFVIDETSVDKSYYINDVVDFSSISMSAIFNDGSKEAVKYEDVEFYFGGEKITDFNELTATAGTKEIEVRYNGDTAKFTITVAIDYFYASSYTSPDFVTTRKSTVSNNVSEFKNSNVEGSEGYDPTYESKFFTGYSTAHLVGDDNAFKFLPEMLLESDDMNAADYIATSFYTNTTAFVKVEESYVELTKTVQEETTKYSYDGTLLLVENNGKNEYDFTEAAIGKEFKLSVLPAGDYLLNEEEFTAENAVAVEVEIVDAYNVYETQDLAVMENVTDGTRTYNGVGYWDSIKTSKGITADVVNALQGIVLQGDIVVKAEELPSLFTYSLGNYDLKYYYQSKGESELLTKDELNALGLSTTFLKRSFPYGTTADETTQEPVLFERYVSKGQTFNFYGNYYSVDASKMPLVAAFDGTGSNGVSTLPFDTGFFSTASLFKFGAVHGENTDMYDVGGTVNVTNVNAKGNANISDLLCAETNTNGTAQKGMPVYAGGIIFMKSEHNTLNMTNVISRTFFINYFGYRNALHNYTNVKAYDSYSNSIWARGATTINVTKSNIERAGGPLFILCDMTDDDGIQEYGYVKVDADSKLESFVTGQEAWFVSVGATSMASQVAALDNLFGMMADVMANSGHPQATQIAAAMRAKTILQSVGTGSAAVEKMNLICATIKDGELLTGASSGYFQYGNAVLDRRVDFVDSMPVSMYGATMMQALASTIQSASVYGYALNITADTAKTFLLKPVDTSISPLGIYPFNLDGSQVTDPTWLISNEPAICLNLPPVGVMLGYYTLG